MFQIFEGKILQSNNVVRICDLSIVTPAGDVIINNFSIEVCVKNSEFDFCVIFVTSTNCKNTVRLATYPLLDTIASVVYFRE